MSGEEESIDLILEAKNTLEAVTFAHGADISGSYAEYAIAQATTALAEEHHTANLIAYLKTAGTIHMAYRPGENVLKSVQARIEERLGLA